MKWFNKHIGDMKVKAAALTFEERGAYEIMLEYYYGTESGLPAAYDALDRVSGAQTEGERGAIRKVIGLYFELGPDGLWHNKTADEQIAKYQAANAKKAAGGWRLTPNVGAA